MDSSKKHDKPSPEASANIFNKLFFWWTLPFFKYGYNHDLQVSDIYNASNVDQSDQWGNILEKEWYAEVERAKRKRKDPKLLTAISKAFIKPYSFFGVILFLQSIVITMLQPIVLAKFIQYFESGRPFSVDIGWCFGTAVVVLAFLNIIIMHYANLEMSRIGMQCRIACSSLVYRKLLRLNTHSLGKTPAGQLVNLLSNDVARFDQTPMYLHYIWIMPIQATIATYILYQDVGIAALAGMGAITIEAVPIQGYLSKKQGQLRYKIAKRTDYRVKLMSEITNGIQVIKMYAWEKPFEKLVQIARKKEINVIAITSYIKGISTALMVYTERFTLYLTIITHVLLGNRLTSHVVFSVAQLFNTVQLYMSIFFPLALSFYAEAKVSITRLEEFLIQGENTRTAPTIVDPVKAGTVEIVKGRASWLPNPIVETLTDINLIVRPGTLCVVVGQVGSGKSSLLQLLLKELPLNSGRLDVSGSVSFASQEPWLFGASVRSNILFGQQFNKHLYYTVVKVCALEKDFEQLPYGDKTLVTERGVSLSGGQRARINLARAVYRQADIYLFDDPLSAVDAHVGEHLFNECINKYLKNKTRILTTHQLQFLKKADMIVIMNNGQIQKVGTFKELSENELKHLRQVSVTEESGDKNVEAEGRTRLLSIASDNTTLPEDDEAEPQETEELMEKGALSSSVYVDYMKAGGFFSIIFLFLMLLVAQIVTNASDLWLTHWTNKEAARYQFELNNTDPIVNETFSKSLDELNTVGYDNSLLLEQTENYSDYSESTDAPTTAFLDLIQTPASLIMENDTIHNENDVIVESTSFYIWVYTILIFGCIILLSLRSVLFYSICMRASRKLHNTMFNNVLQATMRFFHTNPSGRILNRFSKDMGAVDELMPKALLDALQVFLVMSGILIMVFYVTPWMIIPTIITALLFYYIRVIYMASAQDVKRLEGITKAPVFSHLNSSLQGISTIRSSNAQTMVSKEFDVLQDQHTGAWFLFIASSEAFGFYMDFISCLYLAVVTFQFLIFDTGATSSGYVGLVISQSLILTGMTQYGVRQSAEAASQMTSAERILQYTKLEKEGPFESLPAKKPHRDWPQKGSIEFVKVYLKYAADDPPVLKNLNFKIEAGQKVGIVGRTGAGKSSLITALFRLAPIDGSVLIDKVDTQTIGLHDLRRNISIIPQEPILFSASVRYNLDPFEQCDDATLWKALDDVELRQAVQNLEQEVSEGGANFSAGQRQLICLARAIVRNNRVLIMDEATANVDPQTDALIQQTIRKNFKNCTVLTIAHRLNTVMDSDKIIVMDAGEMVEFNHPHVLLMNRDGYLNKMVETTGPELEAKLRKVAEEAYLSKDKTLGVDEVTEKSE